MGSRSYDKQNVIKRSFLGHIFIFWLLMSEKTGCKHANIQCFVYLWIWNSPEQDLPFISHCYSTCGLEKAHKTDRSCDSLFLGTVLRPPSCPGCRLIPLVCFVTYLTNRRTSSSCSFIHRKKSQTRKHETSPHKLWATCNVTTSCSSTRVKVKIYRLFRCYVELQDKEGLRWA